MINPERPSLDSTKVRPGPVACGRQDGGAQAQTILAHLAVADLTTRGPSARCGTRLSTPIRTPLGDVFRLRLCRFEVYYSRPVSPYKSRFAAPEQASQTNI
jgi:hypothetical protein